MCQIERRVRQKTTLKKEKLTQDLETLFAYEVRQDDDDRLLTTMTQSSSQATSRHHGGEITMASALLASQGLFISSAPRVKHLLGQNSARKKYFDVCVCV